MFSYDAMQSLLDAVIKQSQKEIRWRNVPVDYVKSAPYLLSFMENYQLKKQIRDFCLDHPEFSIKEYAAEKYLLLKRESIHIYRPISSYNARLQYLKDQVFTDGQMRSEMLLWVPASRPYYRDCGVFERNKGFSKVLVFSSWEMVPRMISVMLSYESERLTIGKLFNNAKSHRWRGYFVNKGKAERRFGIGRLQREAEDIVCFARLYGNEYTWEEMFSRASKELKGEYPDLVPCWCLPDLAGDSIKIERIVPMYPFSQDKLRYDRIIKILSLYRLTLGQPRQEEVISLLDKELAQGQAEKLYMNLSPFYHAQS